MPSVVEDILQRLVGDEVNDLEGNVHAELRCVAPIEGSCTFVKINSSDTVEGTAVGGVVHLQTLLYNCKCKAGERVNNSCQITTFMIL